jgi:hypothetical protein
MYDHERQWEQEPKYGEEVSIWYPKRDGTLQEEMRNYLESRHLDYHTAIGYGWYPAQYHGARVIIPCQRTDRGNFWQGRLMDHLATGGEKRWDSPRGPRGDAICILENDKSGFAAVVEGPMCALAAAEEGFAAVAVLGLGVNGPVLAHTALIIGKRLGVLVPDKDAYAKWVKMQSLLGTMGVRTLIIDPSPYKDLADMPVTYRKEKLDWARSQ